MFSFFHERLPEVFLATQLDTLTGGLLRWRTIQNLRSKAQRGELAIPEGIFAKVSARKITICRDPFLLWISSRVTTPSGTEGGDQNE